MAFFSFIINIASACSSGSVASSCLTRLEILEQSREFANYQKYNWQHASNELAICTAIVWRCRVGPRALLHALLHYVFRAKIILTNFNSAVSTPTAKLSNLNPCHIFWIYDIMTVKDRLCCNSHTAWHGHYNS